MKSICFEGIECEDIIMHLARLFWLLGFDIAIIDDAGSYSFSEIPLYRSVETIRDCDLLLINNSSGGRRNEGDVHVLVTDMKPQTARELERKRKTEDVGYAFVVFRDPYGNENMGDYLMNLLKLKLEYICLKENKKDFAVRCCLQEGINYRLKNLSSGMRKGLIRMASRISELPAAEIGKAVRREKRWGRSSNSYRDPKAVAM